MASKISLDDKPDVNSLKKMKSKTDGLNVIEVIAANDYRTFGMFLLDDKNGQKIDGIKKDYRADGTSSIVEAILTKWIKEGSTQKTYRQLIACLKESEMGAFAEEMEEMIGKETGINQALPSATPSAGASHSRTIATDGACHSRIANHGDEIPKFSMDDEYAKPIVLQQNAHEEIKKVRDFAKNVRIVIQSCNGAEYRAALEMLESFQDFNAPIKYPDSELMIFVGTFAGQNAAIVETAQGEACKEQLKRVFTVFPNARLLLGLGICYGIKDNAVKRDLQFADVLVASEIGVSKTPKIGAEGVNPKEKFKDVQPLVFNIFCKDSKWGGFTVCEVPKQRTAKVYVGRLCSASILMNDPDRMKKIKEPWREYLGGEMEGWAQFEVSRQCIIIKGISDFADGKKNDDWQLTAAKAAVSYAHKKLEEFGYIDYEQLETPSF